LAFAAFLCFVLPAAAQAESAWWNLTAGSRPAYIDPGAGSNEVTDLTVSATGGEMVFYDTNTEEAFFFPWNASADELEAGLEAYFGPGSISITGGPGDEEATHPYHITLGPGKSFSTLTPEFSEFGFLNCEAAVGPNCKAQAVLHQVSPAKPDGEVYFTAENVGDASLTGAGSPVKLTDVLPAGLEATAIEASRPDHANFLQGQRVPCELATLTCTLAENTLGQGGDLLDALAPFDQVEVRVSVNVTGPVTEPNEVKVSGGESFSCQSVGAGNGKYANPGCYAEPPVPGSEGFERTLLGPVTPAGLRRPLTISSAPVPFGVETYGLANEEEGGAPATQAGSHPFQQTTTIVLNQGPDTSPPPTPGKRHINPAGLAKDVHLRWPAGLLGNLTHIARCTDAQFFNVNLAGTANQCPASSALGVVTVLVNEPSNVGVGEITVPLFNLVPHYGEPARLGFNVIQGNSPVVIDTAVRSDGDYGLTIETNNITQTAAFLSASVTVFGTPGDPRHNGQRGSSCVFESRGEVLAESTPCASTATQPGGLPAANLTLPTNCAAPLATEIESDQWNFAGAFSLFPGVFSPTAALIGCNRVPFNPQIHSEPTSDAATSPTGLKFDLDFENEGLTNSNPEALAESTLKRAVVTLPEGFTTNPSVAEGLKACSEAEYKSATTQVGTGCTEESKVGEVEVTSPLVQPDQVLKGGLFVARQRENPNHNLLTLYLIARNPEIGVVVRQALEVTPNETTGQLTTEVDEVPQLPFSNFHLSFRQGQRSPLITPPACGTYAVKAKLYPWSNPTTFVERESAFQITSGPEGLPCPSGGVPPFHPALEAGTQNNAAGTYSPFYAHITRKDSEQEITHFSIKLPPGVIGKLAGVGKCSDGAIAAAKAREHEGGGQEELDSPSCPASSEIGHTLVGTGVGNVLAYAPGKVYLAGPYHGAPISIVAITAAKVGPFDLGTVVVREALKVNPETAEVFVDATGSDPIPHIVDGIPTHLRDIRVYVDRPEFVLNPTSCAKKSTASTVLGSGLDFTSEADDVPITVSSPFQAADCAALGFKPKLALKVSGPTHRGGVPKFKATLTYPKQGAYANIAKSVLTLPFSEILEQGHIGTSCTRVQFNEGGGNGEHCPAASIYGRARAVTPLLDEPLEGPVYLRSNGGERNLPDLVAALHGEEINVDLVGFIDAVQKKGSERSRIRNTFASVPDAPVSKFTLEMKGASKGLLVNTTNICKGIHRAVSVFTAQNGKRYETDPKVVANSCGKGKRANSKHTGGR